MTQLNEVREDVKRRVVLEEERQMVRTNQVDGWLQRVEATDKSVGEFLEKASQKRNCCTCYWFRYKLAKEAVVNREAVEELIRKGLAFNTVAEALPHGVADERPLRHTVGLDSPLAQVNGWIEDDNVKIIGIYGMGGVGKTTLLNKVNNTFLSTNHGFDKVIWVVVSKTFTIGKVQDKICEQLNIPDDKWKDKDENEKAVQILRILGTKKFVLMLDDVWSWLDLVRVGVPDLDGKRMFKIVITTRYEHVCDSMRQDRKINVSCLENREAMELFMQQVGPEIIDSHPSIRESAETVVKECDGLPLALITVGRAMAGKKDPRDWDMAVKKLRRDPSKIMGVEDHVYHVLKFSYDSLPSDTIRLCFSYCCIFPEDFEIDIEDLLDLWIAEGFLEEYDDLHEARDQGRDIIRDLKAASLLEGGRFPESVKMHDVIRDMALWISNGLEKNRKRYLVLDHIDLVEECAEKMMEAERVSLWGETIVDVKRVQPWKNTLTLMMRNTRVEMLPSGLVQCMFILKVLDLSWNRNLVELPSSIGELVQLEFLNLSLTAIKELPIELKNSTKMKHLLLDYTDNLEVIPRQVISNFPLLRTFRWYGFQRSDSWDVDAKDNILSGGLVELLELLEGLQHISTVFLTLFDKKSMEKLNNSPKLLSCLSRLSVGELISVESLCFPAERMRHLEMLAIGGCQVHEVIIIDSKQHQYEDEDRYGVVGIYDHSILSSQSQAAPCFHNLNRIYIYSCPNLLDLSWLVYAPMLQSLTVKSCRSMVEIVIAGTGHDVASSIQLFSRLKDIYLSNLPCLKSMYPRPLPFSSLVEIHVRNCKGLKRLPFDWRSGGGGCLKKIKGEREWWEALQWEDPMLEHHFSQYFVSDD
ncbi:probable disease resistance protein At1g12290 isoform X2 [Andrographis paniculata]|nr:probable disease resistance protein At1g12290 isoform X2 [Andrographis paniculata]